MLVTRKPEDDFGDAKLGTWNKPGDDYYLIVDDKVIGSTWWCGADYIRNGERWASYGPAGVQMGFRTREAAEAAQVKAYAVNPSEFDRLVEDHDRAQATERARRDEELAVAADARTYTRRAARLGADEPGTTVFTLPAHHHTYGDETEVNTVAGWLEANGVEADTRHEIRVEQRAERTVIVFEEPAYANTTETRVITMTVPPPFPQPAARPDLAELLTVHSRSLFPLADHRTVACSSCTPSAGALVPWPCPTVLAAIGTAVSDAA